MVMYTFVQENDHNHKHDKVVYKSKFEPHQFENPRFDHGIENNDQFKGIRQQNGLERVKRINRGHVEKSMNAYKHDVHVYQGKSAPVNLDELGIIRTPEDQKTRDEGLCIRNKMNIYVCVINI